MRAMASSCDLRSEMQYRAIFIRERICSETISDTAYWESHNAGGAVPKTSCGESNAL